MIHGEFLARKFLLTMVADPLTDLLLPPRGLAQFTRFGFLPFDVFGTGGFKGLVTHAQLINAIGHASSRGWPIRGTARYDNAMSPNQMIDRLKSAFPNAEVRVVDLTGTENHYEVFVKSGVFAGLSRIEQHQKVMAAFSDELRTGEVHALAIKTQS